MMKTHVVPLRGAVSQTTVPDRYRLGISAAVAFVGPMPPVGRAAPCAANRKFTTAQSSAGLNLPGRDFGIRVLMKVYRSCALRKASRYAAPAGRDCI